MAIKGLAGIKAKAAEKAGGFDGESPFLSLKADQSVKVRFLQEFDDESPNYDERRGTILVVEEHNSPTDFKKTAECTAETEGRCWACEQVTKVSNEKVAKKWKPKMRFYANVLVRNPDGGDKVKILKRGFSDKDIGNDLIGIAEEFDSLGAQDVKISRKGSGMNDTSYSVLHLAPKPLTKEEAALELIDPRKFVKSVSYEQMAEFFTSTEEEGGSAEEWLSE